MSRVISDPSSTLWCRALFGGAGGADSSIISERTDQCVQNKDYEQNLAKQNFAASSNSIDTDRISAIAHRATAAMKLASAILHALVLRAAARPRDCR